VNTAPRGPALYCATALKAPFREYRDAPVVAPVWKVHAL